MLEFFNRKEKAEAEAQEEPVKAGLDESFEPLDDYMASLWSYDLQEPKMGMRPHEELEKIFYGNEFKFSKRAYQPGELGFMAAFSERLIQNMMENRTKEVKRQQEQGDAVSEEEKTKLAQLEELLQVTINRRKVVLKDLAGWIEQLPTVAYFRSPVTRQPYIDGKGRIFIYTERESLAKAKERLQELPDVEVASAPPQALSERLYINGSEILVVNDGTIAFTASREELFGPVRFQETAEESERIPDENRAIRYFALGFLQLLRNPREATENRQQALTQMEAQMAPRFLQAKMKFRLVEETDKQMMFALLADGEGHQAIAAYTDTEMLPKDHKYILKELSFYHIAQKVLEDGSGLSGILLNPGELNFFLDKAWLKRLVKFGEYLKEQAKQAEQKK